MLNILKSWLSSHLLRLIGWGVAGLSVLTALLGARQAGRNAERNDQLKKIIEVKGDWTLLPVTLLKRRNTAVPTAKAKSTIPNNT